MLECSNYRPIGLLSHTDKLLERLFLLIKKEKLKCLLQFGFRQKHSTIHALVYLTDKIRNETDKGSYASRVFADFSKTFDIVDRHMLSKN